MSFALVVCRGADAMCGIRATLFKNSRTNLWFHLLVLLSPQVTIPKIIKLLMCRFFGCQTSLEVAILLKGLGLEFPNERMETSLRLHYLFVAPSLFQTSL